MTNTFSNYLLSGAELIDNAQGNPEQQFAIFRTIASGLVIVCDAIERTRDGRDRATLAEYALMDERA